VQINFLIEYDSTLCQNGKLYKLIVVFQVANLNKLLIAADTDSNRTRIRLSYLVLETNNNYVVEIIERKPSEPVRTPKKSIGK